MAHSSVSECKGQHLSCHRYTEMKEPGDAGAKIWRDVLGLTAYISWGR